MAVPTVNRARYARETGSSRFGVGLRFPHIEEVLASQPDVACFEVHPENFMHNEAALARLEKVREHYPLCFHGVALSLGTAEELDVDHLFRLKALADRLDPWLFSEHLAWSASGGTCVPDLLPLPYTEEALNIMVEHVDQTQEALARSILIENPASYLSFTHSVMGEAAFLSELVKRTGCQLLCDVNNIYVSSRNLGWDAQAYLRDLPVQAIAEFHLAGHTIKTIGGRDLAIDDHGSCVASPVWDLFHDAVVRSRTAVTLVEWDGNLPNLEVLLEETVKARRVALDARVGYAGDADFT
jgi:uncharacterized protein